MTLLERLRCDRGLTQVAVEQATGINHRTLVKYEAANTPRISFARLRVLGEFYGVPASELLEDIRRCSNERDMYQRQRDAA